MRSAGLQGFAILHHGFDTKGIHRSGKAFGCRLSALNYRHGQIVFRHAGIHLEHELGPLNGFFFGRMRGVSLLP